MSTSRRNRPVDLDACPCSGATLARLVQPAIMTLLAGGPLHGYRVVQRLAKTPILGGSRPDPTGVYRMLRLMQRRGLVVSTWDLSDTGPAKRRYRLTAEGRQCLARWAETLATYRRAVGSLLSAARKAARGGRRTQRKEEACRSRAKWPSSRAPGSDRSSAR